jgi:hypothetical protein
VLHGLGSIGTGAGKVWIRRPVGSLGTKEFDTTNYIDNGIHPRDLQETQQVDFRIRTELGQTERGKYWR